MGATRLLSVEYVVVLEVRRGKAVKDSATAAQSRGYEGIDECFCSRIASLIIKLF